ncbi:PadR family transcriptional regulator [Herbihabitans rhizosphaerae]|uniref:PadR family transcriptional regulator n=1 Tax=Herbihabitans rhizosphaerae TaxID=1872711 RepID=A0A4Q7KXT9_9PSEU|nr:PadR family transcriptional regulator [Herbihabitans rhizosphaerae]RZS40821.1 PadR family transcriptional regulator [Herbihabitans rhizosphaerae]
MSATRLMVLGVVRMAGKANGYQVRRELLSWAADRWGNVKQGSIYHALRSSARDGLLDKVAEFETDGQTQYQITEHGDLEFLRLLSEALSSSRDDVHALAELNAAIVFLTALPRARAISLLEHRATQLDGSLATIRHLLEHAEEWGQPEHVRELYLLWESQNATNLEWTRGLIERLERGEYVMADDGPSFGSPVTPADSGDAPDSSR